MTNPFVPFSSPLMKYSLKLFAEHEVRQFEIVTEFKNKDLKVNRLITYFKLTFFVFES